MALRLNGLSTEEKTELLKLRLRLAEAADPRQKMELIAGWLERRKTADWLKRHRQFKPTVRALYSELAKDSITRPQYLN